MILWEQLNYFILLPSSGGITETTDRLSLIFHAFLSSADFFKINIFEKLFQEYHQC